MTYWISCNQFTVLVHAEDGRIVEAAPIVKRFVGQPLQNLINWADKLGGLSVKMLPTTGVRHG